MQKEFKIVNVGGDTGSESFLVMTENNAVLVDSGFLYCADTLVENIKAELGDRKLDYCLLTHSHYDHISGAYIVKKAFNDTVIVADEYAARVLSKPSVIKVVNDMNKAAADERGAKNDVEIDEFVIDLAVKGKDVIELSDYSLEVIHTPGHTKCSISFYSKELDLYIASESIGVYAFDKTCSPACLVSYKDSLNSIENLKAVNPKTVLLPHYGTLTGKDTEEFIAKAVSSAKKLKEIILNAHKEGKEYSDIYKVYENEFYTIGHQKGQPRAAFELNASYMIPMVIRECSEE